MWLLAGWLCVFLLLPAWAADPEAMRARVERAARDEGFSGVVLAADGDDLVLRVAVGEGPGGPLAPDTRFPVASLTKPFTAVLVLQLVEEGRLRLDQPVSEILPGLLLRGAERVTIDDLLHHTSGMPTEENEAYDLRLAPWELVNRYLGPRAKRPRPGTFSYNNLDFVLLGLIVEKLRGRPYAQVLQERILEPAGMARTILISGEEPLGWPTSKHFENYWAAAGLASTVDDLWAFSRALQNDTLLGSVARTTLHIGRPELGFVGPSHWVFPHPLLPGHPITVERRGGLPGFNHVMLRFLDTGRVLVVLSNSERFDPDTWAAPGTLKEDLVAALFQPAPP